VEDVIEGDPRRKACFKHALAGGQRLERYAHIVVSGGLVAGERAGVATHIGEMRRQSG
jgi:hypothetical protein